MTIRWSARASTVCFPDGDTRSSPPAMAPRPCARSRPRNTTWFHGYPDARHGRDCRRRAHQGSPAVAAGRDRQRLRHGRERSARTGGWVSTVAQAAVAGDDRDSARDALRERRVHTPDAAVGLPAGAPRVAADPRVGGADGTLLAARGGLRRADAVSSTCWSCRSPVWSRRRRSRSGSAVALWPSGCPGSRPGSETWRSSSPRPSSGSPTSSRFRSWDWGCWSGSASGPHSRATTSHDGQGDRR